MDNYYYPMGADNSDAPWNQVEPELFEEEVEVLATASISTIITPCVGEKHINKDEDGVSYFYELADDWREVARDEFQTPDLKWKPITEQPKRNSWILVRKKIIGSWKTEYDVEMYFDKFTFKNEEVSICSKGVLYEWSISTKQVTL